MIPIETLIALSTAVRYVNLFGIAVGWYIVSIGIWLMYNRRYRFPQMFSLVFYSVGLGLILIANRAIFPRDDMIAMSLLLTVVGYTITILGLTAASVWLVYSHPQQWELKKSRKEKP